MFPFFMSNLVNPFEPLDPLLKNTIKEDVARTLFDFQQINSPKNILLAHHEQSQTIQIITRQDCILCGAPWFDEIINQEGKNISVEWYVNEGAFIFEGRPVCAITGNINDLLSIQRYTLVFLNLFSKVATEVSHYNKFLKTKNIQLSVLYQQFPLFIQSFQYAVRVGGGVVYDDRTIFTMNDVKAVSGLKNLIGHIQSNPYIEQFFLEVNNLNIFKESLDLGIEYIIFKNDRLHDLEQAVLINQGKVFLEVAGNIVDSHLQKILQMNISAIQVNLGLFFNDLDLYEYSL